MGVKEKEFWLQEEWCTQKGVALANTHGTWQHSGWPKKRFEAAFESIVTVGMLSMKYIIHKMVVGGEIKGEAEGKS